MLSTTAGGINPSASPPPTLASIAADLRLFVEPGQVFEVRALKVRRGQYGRPHTESGFFDYEHIGDAVKAASELTNAGRAKGVYFTLNTLKPDILARRANHIGYAEDGELAKDADVLRRRWILVDADPIRDPLISATDEEKALALEVILSVREHLRGQGWAEPIFADSGNGFHLACPIDQPADDGGTVKRILAALAGRFNTDRVKIDQSVFNPSRICKFPGTWARKGDSITSRPHRRARILEAPR